MSQPSDISTISTYAFLDLETTGLPSPGNKPRITEISLLAYSKEELLTKSKEPRVCNKLTLCLNPCRRIHHRSAEITGLYNDALEGLPTFRVQANLIVSFLKNLPQPVCLIAHNGNRFDFPLLKAELKKCQLPNSIDEILFVDSLSAFRNFASLPSLTSEYLCSRPEFEDTADNISISGTLRSANGEQNHSNSYHSTIVYAVYSGNETEETSENDSTSSNWSADEQTNEVTPKKSSERNIMPIPLKRGSIDKISLPKTTAKKRLFSPESDGASSSTEEPDEAEASLEKATSTEAQSENKQKNLVERTPTRFNLPMLYKYYFGQDPDIAHSAEDDCATLMKIVKLNCDKFLTWCHRNARPLQDINPLY